MRLVSTGAARLVQTKLSDYFNHDPSTGNIPAFGSTIENKCSNAFRVAFQNVNGMKLGSTHTGAEELDGMKTLGIDLLGLVETNLNWSHDQRTKLSALIKLAFNGAGRSITSSTVSTKEGYLPGGTAMIARGKVIGRCHKSGRDNLGRFTWMALRGRDGIGVLILTAYRVGQVKGTKAGPNTAYMREWVEMRNRGELSPDP